MPAGLLEAIGDAAVYAFGGRSVGLFSGAPRAFAAPRRTGGASSEYRALRCKSVVAERILRERELSRVHSRTPESLALSPQGPRVSTTLYAGNLPISATA